MIILEGKDFSQKQPFLINHSCIVFIFGWIDADNNFTGNKVPFHL